MRIHQLHAGFIPGDAVCDHMIEIDTRLRAWGFESAIFARYIAPEVAGLAHPDCEYAAYLDDPDTLLLYHYGLYTSNIRYFQATRGRRILIYHNITPAIYYRGWNQQQELLCDMGRQALTNMTQCDLALGDSDFNRRELVAAGFPEEKTDVLPIFLPQARFEALPSDQNLLDRLRESGTINFLTVGRVVPSKAIKDVIQIFYVYHRSLNPHSRLYIVGSRYMPAYNAALNSLVTDMGLGDAVVFTGRVSNMELATYYRAADLYLTASRHEGFCVPLLESAYFGVPILARKAGAIPETLGGSGVLFTDSAACEQIAEMAHLLITNVGLRQQIVHRQKERFATLKPEQTETALRRALERVGVAVEPLP